MEVVEIEKNGVISYSNQTSSSEKLFPEEKSTFKSTGIKVNEVKRSFNCSICNKDFKQKKGLKYHIDTAHEGKKSHMCNICNSKFTTEQSMKNHKSSVHEGGKGLTSARYVTLNLLTIVV